MVVDRTMKKHMGDLEVTKFLKIDLGLAGEALNC
jgi:hypothetical protein